MSKGLDQMKKPPKIVEFVCNLPGSADPEDWAEVESSVTPRILVESDQRFERIGKSNNFKGPPYGVHAFTEDFGLYTKPPIE